MPAPGPHVAPEVGTSATQMEEMPGKRGRITW